MIDEGINRMRELLLGDPEAESEAAREGFLKRRAQSVERFSHDIGVTRTSVYGYINDKQRPTLSTLVRICEALGIPLSEGRNYCTPRESGRQPRP